MTNEQIKQALVYIGQELDEFYMSSPRHNSCDCDDCNNLDYCQNQIEKILAEPEDKNENHEKNPHCNHCFPKKEKDEQNIPLETDTKTITVRVKVKRGLTPQQVLDGTGRVQYTDKSIVETMPLEGGDGEEEVEFVFFKVGRSLPDSEVEAERKKRGLVQDLAAQAQYNADHPEFADDHPNGNSWNDANGKWCFACFGRWDDERLVRVHFSVNGWDGHYWFGGRKLKKEKFVPKDGERIYTIYANGCVLPEPYNKDADKGKLEFGAIFPTKEAAEAARDKIKILLQSL